MKAIAGPEFNDWSDEAGVVGLWEVVKHYRYFRREFQKTLDEIAAAKPDAVVLIDYPGFNLRLARAAPALVRRKNHLLHQPAGLGLESRPHLRRWRAGSI